MKSLKGFLFKRGILKTIAAIAAIAAIGFNTRLKTIDFNTKLMGSWMIGAIGFNTKLT